MATRDDVRLDRLRGQDDDLPGPDDRGVAERVGPADGLLRDDGGVAIEGVVPVGEDRVDDPAAVDHVREFRDARHDLIRVQGARENNLKDVSVEIPKRRLTVFTGVSGSGKSVAGVRHDRRGVAAPDQRDLQRLRPGLHAERSPAPTSTCSTG
jgi:hypothetical protein